MGGKGQPQQLLACSVASSARSSGPSAPCPSSQERVGAGASWLACLLARGKAWQLCGS